MIASIACTLPAHVREMEADVFREKVFNERGASSPVAVLTPIPRPAKSLIIVRKTRLNGDKIRHAKPTRVEPPGLSGAPLTATRIANRSMRVLSGALLLLLLTLLASSMVGWTESQPVVAPRADSGESGETHHSHPNEYCKISALYGRTVKQPAPQWIEFYEPALEVVFDCFGEDRVVFGSD
jgi:hypothetical protein